jgi:hypothetical protein
MGAVNLWLLGYPEQTCQRCQKAYALAKELGHTHSLAWGLFYPAMVYAACGDRDKIEERVEELITLSNEHGFPHFLSIGTAIHGRVLRARAKITSHFRIPSSGHLWPRLNRKIFEIVLLFLWFCSIGATKSNPNSGANSVNLFLREPLAQTGDILRRSQRSLKRSGYCANLDSSSS